MASLEGIRVIEVGQFYFGPYCSMLLARHGADVLKVEAPEGDPYRRLPTRDEVGTSVQFTLLNSGKRHMNLDLKRPEGRDVFLRLVRKADVVVQNLSPGAMDRFGLGYDALSAENPGVILASGSGYGSFGPNAGKPAMDLTVQARSAVMSTTGFDEGPPLRTGPSVVDFMGGAHLLAGVLAALYERTLTGKGQHVEVALQDAIIPSLSSNIAGYVNSGGTMPERTGNRNGGLAVAPYNAYPTFDERWVTILCPTDAHWDRLGELMQNPETDDERFSDMAGRTQHMDLVDELVGRWTRQRSLSAICADLEDINIPFAPVVTLAELLDDPHVEARGIIRRVSDESGSWMTYGSPLFLSNSPMVPPTRAGAFGRDTVPVLKDELELTENEITELRVAGII